MEAARAHDKHPNTGNAARERRAHAARQARGLLAGAAGRRVLSEELIAERRQEARREAADTAARNG